MEAFQNHVFVLCLVFVFCVANTLDCAKALKQNPSRGLTASFVFGLLGMILSGFGLVSAFIISVSAPPSLRIS